MERQRLKPARKAFHAIRRAFLWLGRLLLALYFAAGLTILAGRYFLMPEIAGQRDLIEQKLSTAIGLPVKIAALSAAWPGLHPRLTLEGLQIHDRQGRPALAFERVEAEVSWVSLLAFELRLHRLEIVAPRLDIRRDAAGAVFIAGLPLQAEGDGAFAAWLLKQRRIVVRDASIVWHDELRGAPPFGLRQVNFDLRNFARYHDFGLTAAPPTAAALRLDLRGNLVGSTTADFADWRGRLYTDLEQADLAAWRTWFDLPPALARGRGDLRLWLDFADRSPTGLIADLRLSDVALRIRPELPELALRRLDGRIAGRQAADGFSGEVRRLTLTTPDGISMPPTDARLQFDTGRRPGGELRANDLDVGALAALAGYLPLPAQAHEQLKNFAPRGRLSGLELRWEGDMAAPPRWRVKGRFERLALAAHGNLPGFSGLSGTLEGDERTGSARIDSRDVHLEIPALFAVPVLTLAQLDADLGWRTRPGETELLLSRAVFQNADTSGEAVGSYRHGGAGPGEIDLSAKLAHAAGNAVWRYMPLVVNKDTRDWLRAAIVGGVAENATLRLKGPLARFPFRDGKDGIFQVKSALRGATLDYAPGWPRMTKIDGDLLFDGARMLIRGQRADIMGVALAEVTAEIPDLEAHEELLLIRGRAQGDTQRFLDFIEASPVGARIDRFTQDMTAVGKGTLDLKLDLPLRRMANTRVDGRYRFADNELRVLPELPPLTAAAGEFGFTADRLQAKNLRARLLGAPLDLEVASAPGGALRIDASGRAAAQALRQEYGWRFLDHLSGEAAWRASVTVKRPTVGVRIESSLEGLASSLPDPFNKSARTAAPLKAVGNLDAQRSEWQASLGNAAALNLLQTGERRRGRIAIGTATQQKAALPERGVTLVVQQPSIDIDSWRDLLVAPANGNGTLALPTPTAIELKSGSVHLLQRDFHDVVLGATRNDGRWRINIDSREARGRIDWDGAGAGRLSGRLARLYLPATTPTDQPPADAKSDQTQELPAVDLAIDDFRLRDKAFGELHVSAENREGDWQAKFEAKNEAARLSGEGRWRHSRTAPETALKFTLTLSDAEKLLARLGLPDAVRRGEGRIGGSLAWAGAPFAIDLPSLSGLIDADIGRGQFKKLEPGVGRLLGVLSLQSLPRRITLDFRDIFSEGFAFDGIAGKASVSRGIMRTDELEIRGPAAKVLLSGQVNLAAETQDLRVRVQPAVGETLATGAMLVNPVAGAVAWLAQKVLNDPLDRALAYEYAVTGGWGDPHVEKIERDESKKAGAP